MKYLEAVTLALLAVFAPIKAAIIVAFALILVDLIVGIWAAKKRGEPITSAGLRRSVTKIVIYELAICTAFLGEQYLLGPSIPATKLVSALVGTVELKSILESLNEINGSPIFTTLVTKLGSKNDSL